MEKIFNSNNRKSNSPSTIIEENKIYTELVDLNKQEKIKLEVQKELKKYFKEEDLKDENKIASTLPEYKKLFLMNSYDKKLINLINKYSNVKNYGLAGQKGIDEAFNTLDEKIRDEIIELNFSKCSFNYFPRLKGFKNLKTIICSFNKIKTLDVSELENLKKLDYSNNLLSKENIKMKPEENTNLKNLKSRKKLDYSNNPLSKENIKRKPEENTNLKNLKSRKKLEKDLGCNIM